MDIVRKIFFIGVYTSLIVFGGAAMADPTTCDLAANDDGYLVHFEDFNHETCLAECAKNTTDCAAYAVGTDIASVAPQYDKCVESNSSGLVYCAKVPKTENN